MSKNILVVDQAPTNEFRLGLEQEGMQSNPNATNSFPIPKVRNQWAHGLSDEDRVKVEEFYGHKFDDKDSNDFWGAMRFTWKNYLSSHDMEHPQNILMVSVAMRLGLCAEDLEQVENNPNARYKFMVHKSREIQEAKFSLYEKQDSAKAELMKIKRTSTKHLMALAYYCTPNPAEIGNNANVAYMRLRELIEGEYTKTKIEGVEKFTGAVDLPKDKLYTSVNVRKAIRLNIIRRKGNLIFYNPMSGVEYGRTPEAVTEYFLSPANQEEYGSGKNPEPFSILAQLKREEL